MSNIRGISGASRIMNRNSGGGSRLQGLASTKNISSNSHIAFRNRNAVCACNRNVIFCMNQIGGIGGGGLANRSYRFSPSSDSAKKNIILCNNVYCSKLYSSTLSIDEMKFLAHIVTFENLDVVTIDGKYYLFRNFYKFNKYIVTKLKTLKDNFLQKINDNQLSLNNFYNKQVNFIEQ